MGITAVGQIILIKDIIKKLLEIDKRVKMYHRANLRKTGFLKNQLFEKVKNNELRNKISS